MNQVLALFNNEMTTEGLKELRDRFPKDLVVDMSDEAAFKEARKVRTERNKIVKAINDRRIAVAKEVKSQGDELVEQVNDIFSVMVDPFEVEDQRRKEEAERKKRELEEKLAAERNKIQNIKNFVMQCQGKNSEFIAETMEAVDSIETESFDKEVIHEAIEAKRETIATLTQMMVDAKAREAMDAEREKMRIQERINNLLMIPSEFFGSHSSAIDKKIEALLNYQITEEEFPGRVTSVQLSIEKVVGQLKVMSSQAKFMEKRELEASVDAVDGSLPVAEISHQDKKSRLELIQGAVNQSIANFLYYDRKEDEDLQVGQIQEAINQGELTSQELGNMFLEALHANLSQ